MFDLEFFIRSGSLLLKFDIGLDLLKHFLELRYIPLLQICHDLILSPNEYECEDFGVPEVEIGLDHFYLEFTQAFLDNPSERAIVWVIVPLLFDVTITVIYIGFIRCLYVLC
jgi:hypothetical protein